MFSEIKSSFTMCNVLAHWSIVAVTKIHDCFLIHHIRQTNHTTATLCSIASNFGSVDKDLRATKDLLGM